MRGPNALDERWRLLSQLISAAIESVRPSLTEEDADLLDDFVENREYEVAYEWLASLHARGAVQVSADGKRSLIQAAELMGLAVPPALQ